MQGTSVCCTLPFVRGSLHIEAVVVPGLQVIVLHEAEFDQPGMVTTSTGGSRSRSEAVGGKSLAEC